MKPIEIKEENNENSKITMATIKTYGDTTHTFIERKNFKGIFLPGFKLVVNNNEPLYQLTEKILLLEIDHVVGNQSWNEMEEVVNWYKEKLGFIKFWSVDDKQIHTEFSALNSTVVCDVDENVKMPINEPAKGKKKNLKLKNMLNFMVVQVYNILH